MFSQSELEKLYLQEKRQVNEIAIICGVSRQTVWNWLKSYGIPKRNVWVEFKCDLCHGPGKAREKVYEQSELHFCCASCYKDYLRNPKYDQWRTGQRIAREVVEKRIGRSLRPGETIHHEDGKNENNEDSNLILFASHSDHMKHHHKLRRERLGLPAHSHNDDTESEGREPAAVPAVERVSPGRVECVYARVSEAAAISEEAIFAKVKELFAWPMKHVAI